MDKLVLIPESVRGLGDVLSPTSSDDFLILNSELTSNTDVIPGNNLAEYGLQYSAGSYIGMVTGNWVTPVDGVFSVSAKLMKSGNVVISSAEVKCILEDGTILSETTDNTGVATFTVSCVEDVCRYPLRFVYLGSDNVAGCFRDYTVWTGDSSFDDLTLQGTADIIEADETAVLLATLTGTDCAGEVVGVPGQTLYFFEEWYPNVRLSGTASIIQSGGTSTLTGQLIDNADGSIIKEAGDTVYFYGNYNHFSDDCTGSSLSPFYNDVTGTVEYTTYDSSDCLQVGTSSDGASFFIRVDELSSFTLSFNFAHRVSSNLFRVYCCDSDKEILTVDGANMGIAIGHRVTENILIEGYMDDEYEFGAVKIEVNGNTGKITCNGTLRDTSNSFDLSDVRYLKIQSSMYCYLKDIKFSEVRA